MATLDEVNRLVASGVSEFRLQSYDGWRLILIGSFDLSYYHDIEVIFADMDHINSPTTFSWPVFNDAGQCPCCERHRFIIRVDDRELEVIAGAVEVVVGKVYHYDCGGQLRSGERIADWVQQTDA